MKFFPEDDFPQVQICPVSHLTLLYRLTNQNRSVIKKLEVLGSNLILKLGVVHILSTQLKGEEGFQMITFGNEGEKPDNKSIAWLRAYLNK